MADSSIEITAGSGTSVDTRTEATNSNHRQVIVIGDPSTNAGVAPVDATAGVKVDLGADNDVTVTGSVAVTQSGTWTVQPGNTANTTAWKVDGSAVTQPVSIATNQPVGTVAHDAGDSGNPLKVGAKAETSPKGITAVADGDRTDLYADSDGMLMVKLNTSGADLLSERVSDTGGTSTAFTNFSAVGSTYNNVTAISIFNSSGTSVYVDFRNGSAGSILWTVAAPAGSGAVISSPTPLFRTSANTALAYDVSAAASTVYISISGYQSKV